MSNINFTVQQQITTDVLLEKYCKGSEVTEDQIFKRVAKGVAAAEKTSKLKKKWEDTFYNNLKAGALGAGRIMSIAGTSINASMINCFVMPVGDSISVPDSDGYPGIYEALKDAAETLRRGGGVGFDFSRIRPKNAYVKGTQSNSSGPCSYIDVFDSSCKTVESAGMRRSATMGVLRIDHPDIFDFVKAKRTVGRWNNFNVSVYVTDSFMQAKNNNLKWKLVHKAPPSEALIKENGCYKQGDVWVYREIDAKELWDTIMQSNYDYAEPGILFDDNINKDNNLRYIERLEATNP